MYKDVYPEVEQFQDKIIAELNKEEEFSRNAAEEKKKYSWEVFVENLLQIYRSL